MVNFWNCDQSLRHGLGSVPELSAHCKIDNTLEQPDARMQRSRNRGTTISSFMARHDTTWSLVLEAKRSSESLGDITWRRSPCSPGLQNESAFLISATIQSLISAQHVR